MDAKSQTRQNLLGLCMRACELGKKQTKIARQAALFFLGYLPGKWKEVSSCIWLSAVNSFHQRINGDLVENIAASKACVCVKCE